MIRGSRISVAVLGFGMAPAIAWGGPVVPSPAHVASFWEGPVGVAAFVAALSLLPFLFMTVTAFVKISTVLQIVRGAIGVSGVPSASVMLALSLALTLLAMAPLGSTLAAGAAPLLQQARTSKGEPSMSLLTDLFEVGREPVRHFLLANTAEKERHRFYEVARQARPEETRAEVNEHDFAVLVPAFLVSELYRAFSIGFALFLPFLVLDVVLANALIALGMQSLNPAQVSLPFKLLLFVAIDGWGLLAQALVSGYRH